MVSLSNHLMVSVSNHLMVSLSNHQPPYAATFCVCSPSPSIPSFIV